MTITDENASLYDIDTDTNEFDELSLAHCNVSKTHVGKCYDSTNGKVYVSCRSVVFKKAEHLRW